MIIRLRTLAPAGILIVVIEEMMADDDDGGIAGWLIADLLLAGWAAGAVAILRATASPATTAVTSDNNVIDKVDFLYSSRYTDYTKCQCNHSRRRPCRRVMKKLD